MGSFVRKFFAPWTAGDCFDDLDDFYDFLLRRNKLLNAVRVVFFLIAAACLNRALNAVRVLFFAAAAVCLMLGYAFEPQPYNSVAVGALVLALGLSLVIIQNEKQLPPEIQNQKS